MLAGHPAPHACCVLPLEEWALIPGDTKPGQTIQNDSRMLGRTALTVGVLDAEDVRATGVPREQPIKERRAGAADMEVAGG